MNGLVLCSLLAATPPSAPAATPESTTRALQEPTLLLSSAALDQQLLLDELRLRWPAQILTAWELDKLETPRRIFVSVRRLDDDPGLTLEIVDWRGRTFLRSAENDDPRGAATTIIALLLAIEGGEEEADLEAIAQPQTSAAADVAQVHARVEQALETRAECPPAPAGPECPAPAPAPIQTPPPPPPPPPPSQLFDLGLSPQTQWAVGEPAFAVPSRVDGLALRFGVEFPNAALLAVSTRWATATAHDLRLHRVAVAVAAGYRLRWNTFELGLLASTQLEPWGVRDALGRLTPTDLEAPAGSSLLLGVGAAVRPGIVAPIRRKGLHAITIEVPFAGQAGFALGGDGTVVGLVAPNDEEAFRLGGLELSLGLSLGFRFARI